MRVILHYSANVEAFDGHSKQLAYINTSLALVSVSQSTEALSRSVSVCLSLFLYCSLFPNAFSLGIDVEALHGVERGRVFCAVVVHHYLAPISLSLALSLSLSLSLSHTHTHTQMHTLRVDVEAPNGIERGGVLVL